jgi:hypothetical protein
VLREWKGNVFVNTLKTERKSTMTQTCNGTHPPKTERKTLSNQLDRLDSIIDALDVGLTGAITDAVKDSVSTAVAQTVRATLYELVSNPDVQMFVRNLVPPTPPVVNATPEPKQEPRVPSIPRPRSGLSAAWDWSLSKVKGFGLAIRSRLGKIRSGIVGGFRNINEICPLKRPFLIALAMGLVFGVVGYFSAPWLAGVLSGLGAMIATMGAQLALWVKRLLTHFPVL